MQNADFPQGGLILLNALTVGSQAGFHTPDKKGRPVNQAFPGLKVVLSPSDLHLLRKIMSGSEGIALRKEVQKEVRLRTKSSRI